MIMARVDEIKIAKEYAEKVLDEQVKAEPEIKRILLKHIAEIIDVSLSYKGRPERFRFSDNEVINGKVNEAIRALNEALYKAIENKSIRVKGIAEEREGHKIEDVLVIAFLADYIKGRTLKQRINVYTTQLKSEIEAFIAAGMTKDMSKDEILRQWQTYMKAPYAANIIKEAIEKGGFAATRIKSKGIHYGKGRYISSFDNLKRLYITTIQQVYNNTLNKIFKSKGFKGWFTIRGSNYPCPICESEALVPHPADQDFLSWHPNCVCLYIPMYEQ